MGEMLHLPLFEKIDRSQSISGAVLR